MSDQTADAAIDIRETTKVYGNDRDSGVVALDNVSLTIKDNEFFTLLGPSGCGKTTLLRLIAGFEQPTQGEILLFGEHLEGLPPYKRPVNTVFQHYALFPHMTVAENIGFGLEMLEMSADQISTTVTKVLALVQMEKLAKRKPNQLSGGQQQRVALARALAPRPKVLLLDEPLSALDFKLRKEMQVELKRLQHETGITFIFVTHDQEEALTMSDRVAVMRDGLILQVGKPRDIYDRPAKRFVADFIGDINILKGRILAKHAETADISLAAGFQGSAGMPAEAAELDGDVSIAIRPEQLSFVDQAGENTLGGTIQNIAYFGSGSDYEIELSTGEQLILRMQNRKDSGQSTAIGMFGTYQNRRRQPADTGGLTMTIQSGQQSQLSSSVNAAEKQLRRTRSWLLAPSLLLILGIGIAPLSIVLVYSFLEPGDFGGVSWNFSVDAYVQLLFEEDIFDETLSFTSAYLGIFFRSVGLALFTAIACLLVGFPTAYFIATQSPAKRNAWLFMITIPFWTNLLIRTYAMLLILRDQGVINLSLIKIGLIDRALPILYTDFAVALGLIYAYLPFMVLPIFASLEKLDFRLVEAGYDLYANRFRVLKRIIIPLAKPGIAAGLILVFIPSLGAFITPAILGGGKKLMIGNLIGFQFGQARNWPFGSAIALVLMVLVLVSLMIYLRQGDRKNGMGHG